MQTRNIVLGVIVVLVGALVWVAFRDQPDRELVQRLTRQEIERNGDLARSTTTSPPDMFRLTSRLIASREHAGNTWIVRDGQSATFVELPFVPTKEGVLPEPRGAAESNSEQSVPSKPGFLGADACAECHQDRYDGFIHTAHHQTSGRVKPGYGIGHFDEPGSRLKTSDENLLFTMTQHDGRYFQQVSLADWNLEVPLDVFTGSAKAGQSFLYWHQDALFQAHISYLTAADQWVISPGYQETSVIYTRAIRPQCLECHITYIDRKRKPNVYHRETAIWGISCERCHGPGLQHVEYHRSHPDEKLAHHIIHPSELPRQRQLDICGQCHSGSFSFLREAFSYRPGEELDQYHKLLNADSSGVGSIHTANQLKRLEMSRCFQASEMTCTSCHDPHEYQRGNLAAFTASCLQCHEPTACGMHEQLGEKIAENCVSCHMPIGDNTGMTLQVSRGLFTVTMIDHYIRVDQGATQQYLAR